MTDKELRKLNRAQLLEMLIEQTEENEELRKQISELEEKLVDRAIAMGSGAETSSPAGNIYASPDGGAQRMNDECGAVLARAHEMEAEILGRAREKAVRIVMGAYGMEGYDDEQKKAQQASAASMEEIFDASFKQMERHNKLKKK